MKSLISLGLLLAATLCHATSSDGQQPATLDPPNPQTAPATQNINTLQNSQTTDLQNQPGLFDAPQGTQSDNATQPQRQLSPPQQYDQPSRAEPGATSSDRSMMRDTIRQSGSAGSQREPGMIGSGRPGELGVFLIDADGPGVVIRQTVVGSAADAAGLEPGDVILQINGQGVDKPPEVSRLIRAIPAGESVTLHVWRDGAEQQIAATLQPAGERYRVGFRGNETAATNNDLDSRTRRLEQQLTAVMQELRQLREEMAQFRTGQGRTSTDIGLPPQPGLPEPRATQPSTTQRGLEATVPNPAEPGSTETPGQTSPAATGTGLPF